MKGVWHPGVPVCFMLCKKCGKELTQGANFCLHCGAPVAPEQDVPQQNGEAPQKKRKGKILLIAAASLLMAVITLAAVFFADIAAWIERAVLPPELLMTKAIASAAKDIGIDKIGSTVSVDVPQQYKIGFYVDEDIQNFLSLLGGGDSAWISELNLQIMTGKEGDRSRVQTSLLVEDESVASLDIIQNTEKAWIGVPELNERYLEFSKKDFSILNGLSDTLSSGKELVKIFANYSAVFLDCIEGVTKENTTLNVEDVRQKVLRLTATVPPENTRAAICQIANKLKEDETARDLLNAGAEYDIHTAIVNWLEDMAKKEDAELRLVAYLDKQNKLVGLELTGFGETTLLSWKRTVSGERFGSRLACGSFVLSGTGTTSCGKENGTYRLTAANKTVLGWTTKDFSFNKNGFSGSLLFPLGKTLTGTSAVGSFDTEMYLALSQKTVDGQEVLSFCYVIGEKNILGLTFTAEKLKTFSADIPAAVVPADKSETVEKWFQSLNWNSIPQRLTDAGVPLNLMESLLG